MFERRIASLIAGFLLVMAGSGFCASLESDWNDFIHNTMIGRFDLARGYADSIISSSPDPLQLFELAQENPNGYELVARTANNQTELSEPAKKILSIIEQGRFIRRSDPKIINEEIKRLSSTMRGRLTAVERLKNAGEYAVPYMVAALQDPSRKDEFANIVWALPQLGKSAVKPLITALQINNPGIKVEIIRALGQMRYPEALGYLRYIVETSDSETVKTAARTAVLEIDARDVNTPSAELFYEAGQGYYNHAESLTPAADVNFANIWFWDNGTSSLNRQKIDSQIFNEMMAMRSCEWALRADPNAGKSIGLWLASFFKAQSTGLPMPEYFGTNHADALTYAKTAGPEYVHQALDMALAKKETYSVLNLVEALGASAGEKSLFFRIGAEQPLMMALNYDDPSVKLSAALAIASALPAEQFPERNTVAAYLAQAITSDVNGLSDEQANAYAARAMDVMLRLAQTRNKVIDLVAVQDSIIKIAKDTSKGSLQVMAVTIISQLNSPEAQRALAAMGLDDKYQVNYRIAAFQALADSAKINASLLTNEQVEAIYALVSSTQAPAELRSAAAGAYGSLNLPSRNVKNLILDQSKI